MVQEIFIGRKQEQNQFRQVLRLFQEHWTAKHLPTVMKLIGKPSQQPEKPIVFLFYGEGGMGKTTLVKELQRIAEQEPFESKQSSRNQFQTLYLDWELHKHDPEIVVGHDQLQPEGVLAVLHRAVAAQFGEVKAFTRLISEIQELEQKVDTQLKQPPQPGQEPLKQELLELSAKSLAWAVRTAAATQTGPVAAALSGATVERLAKVGITLSTEGLSHINRLVSKTLTIEEQAIYARPQEKLAIALGEGLAVAAKKRPLVIILDTYEIVDNMLCDYALRQVIEGSGGKTVWAIAGRANLADSGQRGNTYFRGYRQDFSEQVYAYPLREFGLEELLQFFARQVPERSIDETQAEALSQFSRGIPFVINLAAELWAKDISFEEIVAPPENAPKKIGVSQTAHYQIIQKMSQRFLVHCLGTEHLDDRQAVFAMTMMRRPDPNLLRAMLNIEQLKPRLQELRQRYSFILAEALQLDNKLKFFLREYLLNPVQCSEPLVQELNEGALTWLKLRIEQTTQGISDRAEWLADEDIAQLLLDYSYQCFWQDNSIQDQAGWRNLILWIVEGWQYNQRWARQLLEVAAGFGQRFSVSEQQRLKRLQTGLAPQAEVDAEAELLKELEKWSERNWLAGDGAEERQAILLLKRGQLLYRKGHYEQALTLYLKVQRQIPDRAVTLIRRLSNALKDLGFHLAWKDGSCIASESAKQAFELATELDPKNSFAWYGLGGIQYEFKDYENAIAACQQALDLDPKASPHNVLGNVYSTQGDYEKAIAEYQKALDLDPKDASPYNGLGIVYKAQGDYEKAIVAYQKAIDLDPKDPYPHNGLGNVYKAQGNYVKAIVAYQKAIDLDPTFAYPQNGLGNVYKAQGDYEKAIAAYQKAIDLDPKYASPHENLGNVYNDQRDYEKAIVAYQKAITLDPKDAYSYNGLGNVYKAQGDYEKAIVAYQKAIDLDPKDAYPYNGLGNVYKAQETYEKAIDSYQQAIALDPKYVSPYNGLGNVYKAQGDYEKAVVVYQQAIDLNPIFAYPHNGLGNVYKDWEDYVKAIVAYQKAIDIDPTFASPHNGLGIVYSSQGDYEKAIVMYQRAIDLAPTFASPHYNLGNLYNDQENYEEAIAAYQQAIALDPKRAYPYYNLGIVYKVRGDYEKAIAAYQQAIAIAPTFASPHNGLGNIYKVRGDYGKAIAAYQQAIILDPTSTYPHNGLGIVYKAQGKYEKAIAAYQQAIALAPTFAYPHYNLGNLYNDQENYEEAIAAYQKAIDIDPTFASPHNGLGIVYSAHGNYKKAIDSYQQAIALEPKGAYPHYNLGNVYNDQRSYKKAIAAYQQAIALDPKYASPYNSLGIVYKAQGKYEKAIAAYQQAIALAPTFAYPHYNLGNLYKVQGEYEKAIAACQQAISLEPTFAYPHYSLGNIYKAQGDYGQAIAAYQQAIALDPKDASSHNGLGNVYKAQGEYEKAIDSYQQAIALDPKDASSNNSLGWFYLTQDNFIAAIDSFNHAIPLAEQWGTPLCNLGIVFAMQDKLKRARELWQQALPLYTDDDDWDNAIIALYTVALGNPSQGLAALQILIDKGALPAALRNALEDAEMLMKCSTPLEGMEEVVLLLKKTLEES